MRLRTKICDAAYFATSNIIGIMIGIFMIMVALKTSGVWDISWIVVLLPILIPISLSLICCILLFFGLFFVFLCGIVARALDKNE